MEEKVSLLAPEDPHKKEKLTKIRLLEQAAEGRKTYRVFYLNEQNMSRPPFTQWSPLIPPEGAALGALGNAYFVRYRNPGESAFFDEELKAHAHLEKVFSPYRDPGKVFTVDVWAHVSFPFLSEELFSRVSPGPYLEIYRLESR